MKHLPKVYDPQAVEPRWYTYWESKGYFQPPEEGTGLVFSMVMPPPNITGSLHMGHALNNTLQDILVRWRRMEGDITLWLPGTDHAGIATQNVVERQLAQEGLRRQDLGREAFVQRVWAWRETSGRTITHQLRRLGASCDWSRERFTLDEGLSAAVREVFVRLYERGLIYRGDYIINWCPRCQTALSDLEVEHEEVRGTLYYVRYPGIGTEEGLVVATTRPETIPGDTAVAVHPEDSRYQGWIGKELQLPVLDRRLPVIEDPFVDPDFGTGTLKITPAHDPHDFEIGLRHGLPRIRVMTDDGHMNEAAGPYAGLDRFACRKQLVEDLRQQGLLVREEPYLHAVGHCYRCKTIIEPLISQQWFVRMRPLAEPAIRAVREGKIRFIPQGWEKTYYEWMENIRDWCISRQIWWGHRIPAWHCQDCGKVTVDRQTPARCVHCGSLRLSQDPDVLDTWFSSALWPFSTLGWPVQTPDLKRFYPTSVLVTGFDILFFWVARMIMMGLAFMEAPPFRTVYIHALVRDAEGQKMSKSRGNVIDPLEIMDRYGTDALRFTLASMASPGRDIKLSEQRIKGYRNFANKIWNAARFILLHREGKIQGPPQAGSHETAAPALASQTLPDRWILHRLHTTVRRVRQALEAFRFDEGAQQIYQFFWHEFCDVYVECAKPQMEIPSQRETTLEVLTHVLEVSLRLLHPYMPFLTEEIWQSLCEQPASVMIAAYPREHPSWENPQAAQEMEILLETLRMVRHLRTRLGIAPGTWVPVQVEVQDPQKARTLKEGALYLERLGRMDPFQVESEPGPSQGAAMAVLSFGRIWMPLEGLVDLEQERKRLEKDREKARSEIFRIQKRLENPQFRARAPQEMVAKEEEKLESWQTRLRQVEEILSWLKLR